MNTPIKSPSQPSIEVARDFLSALAPGETNFTFQTFDDNHDRKLKDLVRVRHGSLDQYFSELTCLSHVGAGVFVTINKTDLQGRKRGNVIGVRAVYVDLDGPPPECLKRLGLAPSILVVSSPGRFHAYWLAVGMPLAHFTPVQKRLIRLMNSDGSVHERNRVMRLPGFPHQKDQPITVRHYRHPKGPSYDQARIVQALEAAEAHHGFGICQTPRRMPRGRAREPASGPSLSRLVKAALNPPEPHCEPEEVRLRSALTEISAHERETWLDVGMALHNKAETHSSWIEPARRIWDDWSQTCPGKYSPTDQDRTWTSFGAYEGTPKTIGSIYHLAREAGWKDPTKLPSTLAARLNGAAVDAGSNAALALAPPQPSDEDGNVLDERYTDLGNARRLVRMRGADLRFVHAWGRWVVWDRTRWERDEDGAIIRVAKEATEAMISEAVSIADKEEKLKACNHAIKSQNEARLKSMISLAESEKSVIARGDMFDADRLLLGVKNGVIDLRSGKGFREGRRSDYVTKTAEVSFEPAATCPNWSKFLDTITQGNAELVAYLQRWTGYMLTGLVTERVMVILWGSGRNGKSVFRETLHTLFGNYAMAADASLLTAKKEGEAATPGIARLHGCRMVSVNETSENERMNLNRVKFIISDDRITARSLYQEPFDFAPTHKVIVSTNHKPIIAETDRAIWDRLHLVPFEYRIPDDKVEPDYRERRLMPELPGILNWALDGLASYQRQGLNPPDIVRAATEDYREDMDIVGKWIEEQCVEHPDPNDFTPTADLFFSYKTWAEQGNRGAMRSERLGRDLAARGLKKHRRGTDKVRGFLGIKLKRPPVSFQSTIGLGR